MPRPHISTVRYSPAPHGCSHHSDDPTLIPVHFQITTTVVPMDVDYVGAFDSSEGPIYSTYLTPSISSHQLYDAISQLLSQMHIRGRRIHDRIIDGAAECWLTRSHGQIVPLMVTITMDPEGMSPAAAEEKAVAAEEGESLMDLEETNQEDAPPPAAVEEQEEEGEEGESLMEGSVSSVCYSPPPDEYSLSEDPSLAPLLFQIITIFRPQDPFSHQHRHLFSAGAMDVDRKGSFVSHQGPIYSTCVSLAISSKQLYKAISRVLSKMHIRGRRIHDRIIDGAAEYWLTRSHGCIVPLMVTITMDSQAAREEAPPAAEEKEERERLMEGWGQNFIMDGDKCWILGEFAD